MGRLSQFIESGHMVTNTRKNTIIHRSAVGWPVNPISLTTAHAWLLFVASQASELYPDVLDIARQLTDVSKNYTYWGKQISQCAYAYETNHLGAIIADFDEEDLEISFLTQHVRHLHEVFTSEWLRIQEDFQVIRDELADLMEASHSDWDKTFRAIYNNGWTADDIYYKAAVRYCKHDNVEAKILLMARMEPREIEYVDLWADAQDQLICRHLNTISQNGHDVCIECNEMFIDEDGYNGWWG